MRHADSKKRALHSAPAYLLEETFEVHRRNPWLVFMEPCCGDMTSVAQVKIVARSLPESFDTLFDRSANLTAMLSWHVNLGSRPKREMIIEKISHDSW
ncbi:hypothetical protein AAW01_11215 [Aurantiacibacter gangjinensis]|uniref:Uncharacterized protein n=1 Tax=Aurantiacibacter gangjinensis TaxID=502682 RepID=A0A0G9MMR7_9SPHN|nr:hypothetical protein AAW01_11215 [Aurantiacibacter gangjinensis]